MNNKETTETSLSANKKTLLPNIECADNSPHYLYDGTLYVYTEPDFYKGPVDAYLEPMDLICSGELEKGRLKLEYLAKSIPWGADTLAFGFQNGWFGGFRYDLAIYIYRLAIKRTGYNKSMTKLAYCYQMGIGVRKNMRIAIDWYKKAAKAGDPYALTTLAGIYIFGPKRYRDVETGIKLCKKASKDCVEAYNVLAICYANGFGVPKNLAKAKRLFKKALAIADYDIYWHNLDCCE